MDKLKKDGNRQASESTGNASQSTPSLPAISAPKGGGAIRSIGEKFSANPVTGTASMSFPLPTSAGRDGFGISVTVSYDSGNGNGPFGMGWKLSTASVSRKTSKGLPRYDDRNQSDVYMLSGAEDLVPIVAADGSVHEDINAVPGYAIRRYRPRVEGGFSQIEQWTNISDRTDVHWRQLSGNNVLITYGLDSNSRISNPEEPGQIYEWLICNSRDCKGNVVHYTYKPEDGVGADVALAHQHNRGPGTDPRRTSNRYLKSVVYGNTIPLLDGSGNRPLFLSTAQMDSAGWMFEVVLDYGEHDTNNPTPGDTNPWQYRLDSFSNYRPGFEVRTSRVCQRFLMFHHFPEEVAVGKDYLVRSVEFGYTHGDSADLASIFTYLTSVQQSGYRKGPQGQYIRKLLPPLEFTYSKAHLDDELKDIDPTFLRDLPAGLATSKTQWIDLHGESISGMLTADEQAWYYKKNTSPLYETVSQGRKVTKPRFEHNQQVRSMPNGALRPQKAQFADIMGTGQLAIICEDDGLIGCYEHDDAESWLPFRSFNQSINGASYFDSDIKLVDLDGDGLTDILAPELGQWFASLGADGFGLPHAFTNAVDEEKGPSLLYTDDMQTVRLADFSGDGMPDIVRLRNGEVCYWPNLGHGRFGAKILMDHSPIFDASDTFDARHIILADIDGSGTTDLIYPHRDGAKIYFNQCGNGWSTPRLLETVPTFDSVGSFTAIDLLGNGTSCLVISSPLPNACSMQYIELMGGIKPHLMTKIDNNLGSVTEIFYESSTKFYLQDKYGGHPWVSKLAFPVHVVESVQTFDRISQNSFRTRYAYHHGFYDAEDREFRGFGMVEQWDVEEISAIADPKVRGSANQAAPWAIPPIYTKTWFHQGASYEQGTISRRYEQEYYREPDQNEATAQKWLLPDTVLPLDISAADIHDACRALKGKMLRQEIYAIDVFAKPAEGPPTSSAPFTVVESNFTLQIIQSKQSNHSAVALASGRETLTITYERHLSDPRIKHAMILETNSFGQILKELSITYGRIQSDSSFPTSWDRDMQSQSFLTYIENTPTNAIEDPHVYPNNFRLPNFCETRKYELTGFDIQARNGPAMLKDWTADDFALINSAVKIGFEVTPTPNIKQKRLLKHDRTLLRKDDLSGLLPLTKMEPRALAGKTYKLAFTSQMVNLHLQKDGVPLLSSPESLLSGETPSEGGYVSGGSLASSGLFPSEEGNGTIGTWWAPSGQLFFASSNDPAQELDSARQTFFLPRRVQNQFKAESTVTYDKYNYSVLETTDLVGNRTTVGERDASGRLLSSGIDYRVLQPFLITDINGNRSQVEFDALGMVTATAVKGKVGESLGDNIAGLDADLPEDTLLDHIRNPTANPLAILGEATTRVIYDAFAYLRSRDSAQPQPACTYSLGRITHQADLKNNEKTQVHHAFSYSDGYGRQIQKKVQTKAGPASTGDQDGKIILDSDVQPTLRDLNVNPRWISDGWIVYNNKGMPVRQFEPYFTDRHDFEFDVRVGVSPVMFYDAIGRVVATIFPDNTFTKQLFHPWRTEVWDGSDTVKLDPRTDEDVLQYTTAYFESRSSGPPFKTWLQQRINLPAGNNDKIAAQKTLGHADTPNIVHFDALARKFLTRAHDKVQVAGHELDGRESFLYSRSEFDVEGNIVALRDAVVQNANRRGRVVETSAYDMLGRLMKKVTLDKGPSWSLANSAGLPLRAWNNRGHTTRFVYDATSRLISTMLLGDVLNKARLDVEVEVERMIYGENHPDADARNLRGVIYAKFDQASAAFTDRKDFKGNAAESSQRICREYKNTVDWAALDPIIPKNNTDRFDPAALEGVLSTLVEDENFKVSSTHDAMNRLLTSVLPHSTPDNISTVRLGYDLLSLVRIDYNLHGKVDGDQPVWTPFLKDVDYHPTGQRRFVLLGNDVRTDYKYDIDRKLIQMTTQRGGSAADTVQDIKYTYDAIHNITNIVDAAQQTKFFRNVVVKPINDYTYDALYRLLEATGREHLGQADQPFWYSNSDSARFGPQPGDGNAMARYTEQYSYDDAGNMLKMKHDSSNTLQGSRSSSWTRTFDYREKGSIDSTQTGNRLSSTSVGNATENYGYDNHGNMVRIPQIGGSANVDNAQWDYIDKLKSLNLGGGGTAYYTYGSDGKRVRKVIEKGPNLVEERLYLGSAELFRRKKSGGIVLERETIHAMDNQRRVALIETRTIDTEGTDRAPGQLIRYQVSTHLDSSSIELDDTAQLLSFEEYSPYGNTTYQGTASTLETPKRYRFTGKERDEESGLSYHGARYYAPWLARWISQDPLGIGDGLNTYVYCHDDPVGGKDPTGMDDTPSFASFDPLMSEISDSDFKFESITPRPAPLTPLATPMTKAQADAHSSVQRSNYRANPTPETPYLETKSVPPWKGAKVQAGHTVPARYATDGLSPADWDKQTMQRLESRSYDVAIMDQSGEIDITTRHRAQDYTMIDDAVADAQKAATGVSALPPEGSMHMGDYQIWRSENIPLDEGKVEFIKSMGEAPIDHTITTEMKLAAAEGDLFVKASKASKLGKGAKALKLLGKAGKHFVAALPVLGMVMGHASAAHAAANGDLQGAALDEAGFFPVLGDLLDAGRGGLALGEALDEGLGIREVAVEHGAVADKLAQDMGFSKETSMYIGAGTSALSAMTVSPLIALDKTATEVADKAADMLTKWWNSD